VSVILFGCFISLVVLLDLGGLALALKPLTGHVSVPYFLSIFPATKGISRHQSLPSSALALLPCAALSFFYAGFYKDTLLSAYDECFKCCGALFYVIFNDGMTFAYRGRNIHV